MSKLKIWDFLWGEKIFDSINLKVYRGERVGIIGPNGVGNHLVKSFSWKAKSPKRFI